MRPRIVIFRRRNLFETVIIGGLNRAPFDLPFLLLLRTASETFVGFINNYGPQGPSPLLSFVSRTRRIGRRRNTLVHSLLQLDHADLFD